MTLQIRRNLTVSNLHKSRDYVQGLLAEVKCVSRINKLPFSIKQRDKR
jgi:hypothetical protein